MAWVALMTTPLLHAKLSAMLKASTLLVSNTAVNAVSDPLDVLCAPNNTLYRLR
jgi:hypothetical protein